MDSLSASQASDALVLLAQSRLVAGVFIIGGEATPPSEICINISKRTASLHLWFHLAPWLLRLLPHPRQKQCQIISPLGFLIGQPAGSPRLPRGVRPSSSQAPVPNRVVHAMPSSVRQAPCPPFFSRSRGAESHNHL